MFRALSHLHLNCLHMLVYYTPPKRMLTLHDLKDPVERLEALRRSSLIEFEHLKQPNHPIPPLRELPEHSVPLPETAVHHHLAMSPAGSPSVVSVDATPAEKPVEKASPAKPLFKEPNFGADGADDEAENGPPSEDVLSPTQTLA